MIAVAYWCLAAGLPSVWLNWPALLLAALCISAACLVATWHGIHNLTPGGTTHPALKKRGRVFERMLIVAVISAPSGIIALACVGLIGFVLIQASYYLL